MSSVPHRIEELWERFGTTARCIRFTTAQQMDCLRKGIKNDYTLEEYPLFGDLYRLTQPLSKRPPDSKFKILLYNAAVASLSSNKLELVQMVYRQLTINLGLSGDWILMPIHKVQSLWKALAKIIRKNNTKWNCYLYTSFSTHRVLHIDRLYLFP